MATSRHPEFARFLKDLRSELGHSSARAFHSWLVSQADLGCNYSYYSRIETGEVLPSPPLLSMIADLLPNAQAEALTLAYCQAQFPKRRKLFKYVRARNVPPLVESEPASPAGHAPEAVSAGLKERRVLTRLQVDRIAKSKQHYLLFLLATLARQPLALREVEAALGSESLKAAFLDLKEARILRGDPEAFQAAFLDMKFPKDGGADLKKIYAKMDAWDRQLAEELQFAARLERFLFIRISARYVGLILSHCELLLGLIRSAEDVDPDHNDEVLSFSIKLHSGRLPG